MKENRFHLAKLERQKSIFPLEEWGGGGIHNYFHDSNYYFQFNFHNLSLVFTRAVVEGGVEFFEL